MKTFHVGVKPDAPFSTCQLAGVGFQKFTSAWGPQGGEIHRPGLYMDHDDDLPERVAKAALTRVVRYRKDRDGNDLSATIVDVRGKGFRRLPGDVGLGQFVYCVAVEAAPELAPTPPALVTPDALERPEVNERGGAPRNAEEKRERARAKKTAAENAADLSDEI